MNLQYGDIIRLDTDHWDTIGKTFKIISIKYREKSTAVDLVVEDILEDKIIKIVVPENQIVVDTEFKWIG